MLLVSFDTPENIRKSEVSFDTPQKLQKTRGSLMFSGGIERDQGHKMG